MTTRQDGVSPAPFDSFNLRRRIGDDDRAVTENRQRLAAAIGATPVYLDQVHGIEVARLDESDLLPGAEVRRADASFTTLPGVACVVLVADCLPILFAAPGGRAVGAAHAGWRGLAAGIAEAALGRVCEAGGCGPEDVEVWLGACIGPAAFEVGPDVLAAFSVDEAADQPRFGVKGPGKWFADLAGLAGDRLRAAGAGKLGGGEWCTVSSPSRFFSFRRDGVTGRMGAAIWIDPGQARG